MKIVWTGPVSFQAETLYRMNISVSNKLSNSIKSENVFNQTKAVSDFRAFGIVIGIFDIVVGGLGNFFTILAFTR